MRAEFLVSIVFALALASAACGDDDSNSSNGSGTGGTPSTAGSGGTTTTGTPSGAGGTNSDAASMTAGSGGTDAKPDMHDADMDDGGMMMPPKPGEMMKPGEMKPPMMPMAMCPATAPADGSACTGPGMCKFADLECSCRKETWSCKPGMMMPKPDGGTMP